MTREEWGLVKGIALEALDRPDAERLPYIESRCGTDPALTAEVESLVASATRAAALFEPPAVDPADALASLAADHALPDPLIGSRLGAYRVRSELGRGGMGVAYLAERADGAFDKDVAIKVVKRGMDTDAILRRFMRERRIVAGLEHPNIARLIDGGTTDDGRPYFVMEFVDGRPFDEHCDARGLTLEPRLRLFLAVCRAVQHAHQRRVVHGDLKPANVLVTGDGVPKLLDFGIATIVEGGSEAASAATTIVGRALTPQFASPEQLAGRALTPASDVYSLGVLLYSLVAGRHPYRLDGDSPVDVARVVNDSRPQPPSAVGASPADGRPSARRLPRRTARALDAITMKAIEKDTARRYQDAGALATDLQVALDGRSPLAEASHGTRWYSSMLRSWAPARAARSLFGAWRPLTLATAALVAVGAGGFVWWRSATTGDASARSAPASIAVIPLINATGSAETEYLSHGLTQRIAGRLSRVPGLRVMTLAAEGAAGDADPRLIARRAQAEAVLTGRLTRRGDTLSVGTALVDVRSGRSLWSAQYDAGPDSLEGLGGQVVGQLATTLGFPSPGGQRESGRPQTEDVDAYQSYLRGLHFLNRRTVGDLQKSIGHFQQAVSRDPRFAAAFAGLADAYGLLTEYHGAPARDTYRPAKDAAQMALRLDPTLAESHTSMAYVMQFYDWDWVGSEREFRRAIELDPNYATAHQWYGELLSTRGRHDEALREVRQAVAIEPLSLIINAAEANLLYMAHRFDESVRKSESVIDLDPNFPEAAEYLKRALDQLGDFERSVAIRQKRRSILGQDATMTPALVTAASTKDRTVYWRSRLEQELVEGVREGLQPFEMAELNAQAGRVTDALEWFERACTDSDFMVAYAGVIPTMDALRGHPRFNLLLERSCRVR